MMFRADDAEEKPWQILRGYRLDGQRRFKTEVDLPERPRSGISSRIDSGPEHLPDHPSSLNYSVEEHSTQETIKTCRAPGPEVRGVEHYAEGDVTTYSEAQGENDPFAHHGGFLPLDDCSA